MKYYCQTKMITPRSGTLGACMTVDPVEGKTTCTHPHAHGTKHTTSRYLEDQVPKADMDDDIEDDDEDSEQSEGEKGEDVNNEEDEDDDDDDSDSDEDAELGDVGAGGGKPDMVPKRHIHALY